MSNKEFDISRRKLLAGLGTAGVAAAGAGLGTTAYLNDTESFDGNEMTAGTLDLKVDWQQAYYGPTESLVPVNAYPDHDGDGLQSLDDDTEYGLDVGDGDALENDPIEVACDDIASGDALPEGVFDAPNRDADYGGPVDQDSLVALDDVKPGDWGEITFSLHLCSNPGYIWLTADNFTEDGGETTEPEPNPDDGELAENTFVELWYDEDCDNTIDATGGEGGQELEVALVSDVSGSMAGTALSSLKGAATDFVDNLASSDEAAAVSFASNGNLDQELTTNHGAVNSAINGYTASGSTNMTAGIDTAADELVNGADATAGANKVMILLSDGVPDSDSAAASAATSAKDAGIRLFTIALGDSPDSSFMEGLASSPDDAYVAPAPSDLDDVYSDIGTVVVSGEQLIIGEGVGPHDDPVTLAEAMSIIEDNDGMIPLDGTGEMGYDAGDVAEERDCFAAETQHCIGMRWWVPTDVGNEIQGDSCGFDLGFYAEQCRHSDGSRPSTETPTETPPSTPDGTSTPTPTPDGNETES